MSTAVALRLPAGLPGLTTRPLGHADAASALLKRMGYRVTAMSDPSVALARLRSTPDEFDLLFTDQSMGMNGVALARASRNIRPDLAIVLTTGFLDEATRAGLADTGVTNVLAKPYQPSTSAPPAGRAGSDGP